MGSNQSIIVTSSGSPIVRIWNISTDEEVIIYSEYRSTARVVDWSKDGARIVSGSSGIISIWNYLTGEK